MAACKMISFNEQYKILTEHILFALCLYFSLSYLGGGGGVSLSIKAWERCIKFSISILIISEFVCALV